MRLSLGILELLMSQWADLTIAERWNMMYSGQNHKAMASLTLLISWGIWNKRNAKVFHNKQAPLQVIFNKIRKKVVLWVLAGAKGLGNLMSGE
jgi:hypothetical protein